MAAASILDNLSRGIGPQFMQYGERLLGVSRSNMESAFGMALPALFAGIVQKGASRSGAENLMHVIDRPELNSGIVSNLDAYLGGGEKTSSLSSLGQSLLPDIFGNRLSNVVGTIAASSGLRMESAFRLLALAAPAVMAFLKNIVSRDHLDAHALSNMLSEQGPEIGRSIDPRLANAFGAASPQAFAAHLGFDDQSTIDDASRTAYRPAAVTAAVSGNTTRIAEEAVARRRSGSGSWWAWLGLAAIVLFLATQLNSFFQKAATQRSEASRAVVDAGSLATFTLPNGQVITVPKAGLIASVIQGLARNDLTIGQPYTLDQLHFDTGSAQLRSDSFGQLDQLAEVMDAYPAAEILIRGYTDSTGDPTANQKLSSDRARSVKQALADRGINMARMATAGMGEFGAALPDANPSNASNRRVEISITKR